MKGENNSLRKAAKYASRKNTSAELFNNLYSWVSGRKSTPDIYSSISFMRLSRHIF